MIDELVRKYESKREGIRKRLDEFKRIKELSNEEIFAELAFCLCTPQSKATSCWNAISALVKNNLLYTGDGSQIKPFLNAVRFNKNKTKYIIEARKLFLEGGKFNLRDLMNSKDPYELRDWLVENVNGFGLKEASHFLRNVGVGNELAILDSHILKNLHRYNVIDELPKSLTEKKYLDVELKMAKFAEKIGIPIDELDLLLWSEETGFIFK